MSLSPATLAYRGNRAERQRQTQREWVRRRRQDQRRTKRQAEALVVGGLAVYRKGDTEPVRVVSVRDGVARVERDGRVWDDACVYLRGAGTPVI